VEIHGANVYRIAEFLSPLTNHRKDRYRGSLENRLNFPTEVLRRVRKKVGKDFPVTFRMVGHQYAEGGFGLEGWEKRLGSSEGEWSGVKWRNTWPARGNG